MDVAETRTSPTDLPGFDELMPFKQSNLERATREAQPSNSTSQLRAPTPAIIVIAYH